MVPLMPTRLVSAVYRFCFFTLDLLTYAVSVAYKSIKDADWSGLFGHDEQTQAALASEPLRGNVEKYSSFFIDSAIESGFCESKNDVIKTSYQNEYCVTTSSCVSPRWNCFSQCSHLCTFRHEATIVKSVLEFTAKIVDPKYITVCVMYNGQRNLLKNMLRDDSRLVISRSFSRTVTFGAISNEN